MSNLGISTGAPVPPAATRVSRAGWRDPRLWVGILLVAGSVVGGARLLAAADDSVTVWAASEARGSGTPLGEADLVSSRIRFADSDDLARYFPADETLPDDLILIRPIGAGELLARTAVGQRDEETVLHVPLEVDPNRVPPQVRSGSVVDVWLSDGAAGAGQSTAADGRGDAVGEPALSEVSVVAAPTADDTFAITGARQLVVAVDAEVAAAFEKLLAGLQEPVIRILQRS